MSWEITQAADIKKVFNKYARNGIINGPTAFEIFSNIGLSYDILEQLWNLSDKDKDNQLNEIEFVLFFHICICLLKRGCVLPIQKLPESLEQYYQVNNKPNKRPPSKYQKGDKVIHHRTSDGLKREGVVVGVHADDIIRGFYYTLKLTNDNQELQANEERLSNIGDGKRKLEEEEEEEFGEFSSELTQQQQQTNINNNKKSGVTTNTQFDDFTSKSVFTNDQLFGDFTEGSNGKDFGGMKNDDDDQFGDFTGELNKKEEEKPVVDYLGGLNKKEEVVDYLGGFNTSIKTKNEDEFGDFMAVGENNKSDSNFVVDDEFTSSVQQNNKNDYIFSTTNDMKNDQATSILMNIGSTQTFGTTHDQKLVSSMDNENVFSHFDVFQTKKDDVHVEVDEVFDPSTEKDDVHVEVDEVFDPSTEKDDVHVEVDEVFDPSTEKDDVHVEMDEVFDPSTEKDDVHVEMDEVFDPSTEKDDVHVEVDEVFDPSTEKDDVHVEVDEVFDPSTEKDDVHVEVDEVFDPSTEKDDVHVEMDEVFEPSMEKDDVHVEVDEVFDPSTEKDDVHVEMDEVFEPSMEKDDPQAGTNDDYFMENAEIDVGMKFQSSIPLNTGKIETVFDGVYEEEDPLSMDDLLNLKGVETISHRPVLVINEKTSFDFSSQNINEEEEEEENEATIYPTIMTNRVQQDVLDSEIAPKSSFPALNEDNDEEDEPSSYYPKMNFDDDNNSENPELLNETLNLPNNVEDDQEENDQVNAKISFDIGKLNFAEGQDIDDDSFSTNEQRRYPQMNFEDVEPTNASSSLYPKMNFDDDDDEEEAIHDKSSKAVEDDDFGEFETSEMRKIDSSELTRSEEFDGGFNNNKLNFHNMTKEESDNNNKKEDDTLKRLEEFSGFEEEQQHNNILVEDDFGDFEAAN